MLLPETRAAVLSSAVHEAGHAVVGVVLGLDLRYVAIYPAAVTAWGIDPEDDGRSEPDEQCTTRTATARASRIDALREDSRFDDLLQGIRAALRSESGIVNYLLMSRAARAANELIGSDRDPDLRGETNRPSRQPPTRGGQQHADRVLHGR